MYSPTTSNLYNIHYHLPVNVAACLAGNYIQTKGLMEQDLMDKIIQYLAKHEAADAKPFYMYYAPHAIHQ
jgi:hypothetical protein